MIVGRSCVALLALYLLTGLAYGECRRLPVKPDPTQTDGPGSFGSLHGTVTLDCLRYVGSVNARGVEWVLIQDERGEVHRLRPGDYMGPGVISAVDAEFIYLDVPPSGVIKFPKAPR